MSPKEVQFSIERATALYQRLDEFLFDETREFTVECALTSSAVPFAKRPQKPFLPLQTGERWGEKGQNAWFHLTGMVPPNWHGKYMACRINLGGELLLLDAKGTILCGLTNTCIAAKNFNKDLLHFPQGAQTARLELWVDAIASGLFIDGDGRFLNPGIVKSACYGLFRENIWQLKNDLEVALSMLNVPCATDSLANCREVFPKGSFRYNQIAAALNEVTALFHYNPEQADLARNILKKRILGIKNTSSAMKTTAVGHGHLDIGWLWTVPETRRKAARTFSSQLALIQRYPDYVFGASQAQLYNFVEENHPELFKQIQKAVKAGRWEVQGGTWVEMDCNLASGESLCRQFLYGKNYFRDKFDVNIRVFWLPDVFGYPGSLPQIAKLAGSDYFVTQKLCWNRQNRFPYSTFHWTGIEGTSILTTFPPGDTYNATLLPNELAYGADNNNENTVCSEFLSLFGTGDGGGGPKEEYIERGLRCRDLEGVPRVKFGKAEDFFRRIARMNPRFPSWHGELFLEMHHGTYTSQAKIKWGNRRCEQTLQQTEILFAALAQKLYPTEQIEEYWKKLLMSQFHDILPGSCIQAVAESTQKDHQEILDGCQKLLKKLPLPKKKDAVTYINTLGTSFTGLLELPQGWQGVEGMSCQKSDNGRYLIDVCIPALETLVLKRRDDAAKKPSIPEKSGKHTMENQFFRCHFGPGGELKKLVHKKTQRELLNRGNVLSLYADRPTNWDAWEIDEFYRQDKILELGEIADESTYTSGPLFQEISWTAKFGSSEIRQRIRLMNSLPMLIFDTDVDWRESHKMLRTVFETTMHHNARARFDIPYGWIQRPVHLENPWEKPFYEEPLQQWMDLSTPEYGLALLNDAKYGGAIYDNVMEQTLLRAPAHPDPQCDIGQHNFQYLLFYHPGDDFRENRVQELAASLNRPAVMLPNITCKKLPAPCRTEGGTATIQTIKRAENSLDWIVRIVETAGRESDSSLVMQNAGSIPHECDLMEWTQGKTLQKIADKKYRMRLHPFEIKTIRIPQTQE